MPTEMKLWRIEEDTPKPVDPDTLDSEARLEEWIRDDIGMVNDDLLVIGQQVATEHTGAIDLLALDPDANLVILELKRDMTPREVVAQALDYASYVQKLGLSDIEKIVSNSDFLDGKSLDQAFRDKFGHDRPDVVNERHRIYIVASALDFRTERIIEYLSETHDVDINAATFAYFKTPNGIELIGRSMLLDEEVVKKRAETRGGSKRRRSLTQAELRDIAERNGVVDLWDKAVEAFGPISERRGTSASSLFFQVRNDGRDASFVSLFPVHTSEEEGLAISLIRGTLSDIFNLPVEEIKSVCGLSEDTLIPDVGTGETHLFDDERLDKLIVLLKENAPEG